MSSHWTATEVACVIHSSLIYFQYRNRFLGQAYNQPLSLLQSHILLEISAGPQVSASTLVNLGLGGQVTIARRVKELSEAKLIRVSEGADDARRRFLHLTPKGEAVIKKLDESSNTLKDVFARGFHHEELDELQLLINQLCEIAEVPPASTRPEDLPPRAALRRMARFMGILTSDFMGSGLSSTEWHALQAIRYSGPGLTARRLEDNVNVEQSSVSRIISRFAKDKLVQEVSNPHDRRSKYLQLTPKGLTLLEGSDAEATRKLASPLSKMRAADRYRLAWLLAHYAFGRLIDEFDDVVCTKLSTRSAQADARRWLVRTLAQTLTERPDSEIPPQLVDPNNSTFVAYDRAKNPKAPCALLELRHIHAGKAEIVSFLIDSELCPSYFRRLEVGLLLVRAVGKIAKSLLVPEHISWPLAFMDSRIFQVDISRESQRCAPH